MELENVEDNWFCREDIVLSMDAHICEIVDQVIEQEIPYDAGGIEGANQYFNFIKKWFEVMKLTGDEVEWIHKQIKYFTELEIETRRET